VKGHETTRATHTHRSVSPARGTGAASSPRRRRARRRAPPSSSSSSPSSSSAPRRRRGRGPAAAAARAALHERSSEGASSQRHSAEQKAAAAARHKRKARAAAARVRVCANTHAAARAVMTRRRGDAGAREGAPLPLRQHSHDVVRQLRERRARRRRGGSLRVGARRAARLGLRLGAADARAQARAPGGREQEAAAASAAASTAAVAHACRVFASRHAHHALRRLLRPPLLGLRRALRAWNARTQRGRARVSAATRVMDEKGTRNAAA
jgi:hypothetical protein